MFCVRNRRIARQLTSPTNYAVSAKVWVFYKRYGYDVGYIRILTNPFG